MMHRAWSSIVDVPYCFSRSYVKFQGHTALKIVEFDPNWAFPDSNSSLNSPMAMKCCTKLETAKERCPIWFSRSSIKFQGHTGQNITDFDPNWAFPDYRPVAAFKSLRFALLEHHFIDDDPFQPVQQWFSWNYISKYSYKMFFFFFFLWIAICSETLFSCWRHRKTFFMNSLFFHFLLQLVPCPVFLN